MNAITIFSKHYWPENFKINEVSFKLKKNLEYVYLHLNLVITILITQKNTKEIQN